MNTKLAHVANRIRSELTELEEVRNIYTYIFDRVKMRKLVEKTPGLFSQVRAELLAFADFLEETG